MAHDALAIGFDADDTLWHNETIFESVHERYRALLATHHDAGTVERTLFATEMRNLDLYGYGIKGFTLSSIETAIQLTDGKISATEIREIIELGKSMLAHPVDLLDGVVEVLAALSPKFPLLLITKGDLRDQERKLAKSGLAAHFKHIEIVSEKNTDTYSSVLRRHGIAPERFFMVGNSLKSDIAPILALGGSAAHIPYHITWAAERIERLPEAPGRFWEIAHLRELPAIIEVWRARVI